MYMLLGEKPLGGKINMINKAMTLMLILSVFTLTFAHPALARTTQTNQDKKTEKIKNQVKKIIADEKVTKKVKMNNGTTYLGFLSQATEDSFVVQDKTGGSTTVKYSDVKSIDKKDVPTALKIGIGAGAGALVLFLLLFFHGG